MSSTQQTRRFDHVYDTTYTTSGARDHARAMHRATRTSTSRVPNRNNLFSEIPTLYKPYSTRIKAVTELPSHVNTAFRPHVANTQRKHSTVSGSNRHFFFRRPMVPMLHSAPPEILLARPPQEYDARQSIDHGAAQGNSSEVSSGPKSTGVQTIIRDSEAQTEPYAPDYIIPEGADPNPEVLTLSGLQFNKGDKITMHEVHLIERARFKTKFISLLPPITDEASFNLRKRMMEEQELREFQYKEDDIDRTQGEHLNLLKKAIDAREAENEFIAEQRIEAMRQAKLDAKDSKLLSIQKKRIKQLRKLAKARARVPIDPRQPPYGIIDNFSCYASKTYAPVLRDGQHNPNTSIHVGDAHKAYVEEYEGLLELEQSINKAKPPQTKQKSTKPSSRSPEDRKQQQVVKHLEWMDQLLRSRKDDTSKSAGPDSPVEELPVLSRGGADTTSKQKGSAGAIEAEQARGEMDDDEEDDNKVVWRKRAEKLVRPPTPNTMVASAAPTNDTTETDASVGTAITLLQQLLRGRAIQMMMFQGKSKRLELIRELRTEEELDEEKDPDAKDDTSKKIDEITENATWGAIQGEVISSTLDLLTKELVRMQQERSVHNMVSDAVEIRLRREMMQAGTRQAEQLRRNREDEIYKQLMLVHQGTVDSYFDEILSDSIECTASEQASAYVCAERPKSARSQASEHSDSEVVQGLVSSFLLPHVQRNSVRSQIELEERRFVEAAHKSIYDILQQIETKTSDLPDA